MTVTPPRLRTTIAQLFRFGMVGIVLNMLLYGGYIVATTQGVSPKLAMSIFYVIGVLLSFLLNRHWSFSHRGALAHSFPRYLVTYVGGYFLNFLLFLGLVDFLGWPHQWVQLGLIFLVAGCVFVSQKYWVFSLPRERPDHRPGAKAFPS